MMPGSELKRKDQNVHKNVLLQAIEQGQAGNKQFDFLPLSGREAQAHWPEEVKAPPCLCKSFYKGIKAPSRASIHHQEMWYFPGPRTRARLLPVRGRTAGLT